MVYFEDNIPAGLVADSLNTDEFACVYDSPLYQEYFDLVMAGGLVPTLAPVSFDQFLDENISFLPLGTAYPLDPAFYPNCVALLDSQEYLDFIAFTQ